MKPAKDVRVGDALQIRIGTTEWTVDVRGLADRRGPAKVAAALYEETAESREARERAGARAASCAPPPLGADLGDAARRSRRASAGLDEFRRRTPVLR